jgi:hypothetical protein
MTVLAQETWRTVELYGGAITTQFPERFVDVSDFRPVPDHQEVRSDEMTETSRARAGLLLLLLLLLVLLLLLLLLLCNASASPFATCRSGQMVLLISR